MSDFHLLIAAIGIGLGMAILFLVRRDHLYIRQGVFWITVALVSVLFGLWPRLVDLVGWAIGVSYPPALLFLIAIVVLMLRSLQTDIALTQTNRDLRRMNQRMALYESSQAETPRNRP